jgi:hypothetical protein
MVPADLYIYIYIYIYRFPLLTIPRNLYMNRTKNLIDQFAEAGYYAMAPKFCLPPFEGGTEGEGLLLTATNDISAVSNGRRNLCDRLAARF